MRNLADRLGIKAPSLYKHVSSRREIETLLAAEALNEMRESLAAADGLEEMGRSYRAWGHRQPVALPDRHHPAHLTRENLPAGLEDAAAAPLLAAVDGDRARACAFWALAHGLVLLELDGRFPGDADLEAARLAGIS